MAGRRAALKAIDWLAFAERVPPNQRTMFNNLKTRSDAISAKFVLFFITYHSNMTCQHLIIVPVKYPNVPFKCLTVWLHHSLT